MSRYYDPVVGRFISADALLSTGQGVLGYNMFAYCMNNPVNRMDPSGCFWEWVVLGGIIVGMLFTVKSDSCPEIEETKKNNYAKELEEAKAKYTPENVSINGNLGANDALVKVRIFESDDGKSFVHIENSIEIESKAEKEAILDVIIASPEFDSSYFVRSKEEWLSEWIGHNSLYFIFSWSGWEDNLRHVDLNEDEVIPWDLVF